MANSEESEEPGEAWRTGLSEGPRPKDGLLVEINGSPAYTMMKATLNNAAMRNQRLTEIGSPTGASVTTDIQSPQEAPGVTMSDRLNWYPETGPERRARRSHRFRTARVWIVVVGAVLAVLFFMGGPFNQGQRCTSSVRVDSSSGQQAVHMECHQVRGWRP